MRVLVISNFYPPYDLGGWEQNCQEIVQLFQSRGHECVVLTSRSDHEIEARPHPEAGVIRALNLQADIHYYRPLDFFLRRPRQERANQQALHAAMEVFQPDIIFIWGMWNLSYQVAYWAERWMPGRVAYAVASYWLAEPDIHEAYWQQPAHNPRIRVLLAPARYLALRMLARERKLYSLGLAQVACVSNFVRKKLGEAGVLPHGARVIYNGIDPQPFIDAATMRLPGREGLQLIYTGGILPHKGVHTAIEALSLLQQRGEADNLCLMLIGGGHPDYEAQLKQRVCELDLEDHVIFRGRVPRDQIPELLGGSDIFLFTSIWEEPIARTVMEAMAAGLAVIGTDVGGQREMLEDDVNSLIFAPEDANGLAQCISRLRHDPTLRTRLSEAGQRMILKRFTLDRMVDEMEMWLDSLAK